MMSSFKIVNILKGRMGSRLSGANFRRGLVVLQFVLSILLIVSAFVVREQIAYMKHKNLGLNKHNVVSYAPGWKWSEKLPLIREALFQSGAVVSISAVSDSPIHIQSSTGDPEWEGYTEDEKAIFSVITADHHFLDNMQIPLVMGSPFVEGMPTDTANFNYLINETAAEIMGLENPINKRLKFWGYQGKIIGVVKDFHFSSLHSPIHPLIIRYEPEEASSLLIRSKDGRTDDILSVLEARHKELIPDEPFRYAFLDATYEKLYSSEQLTSRLADIFALVALLISCLGLLGLSAFTAERRTKEIGIRKVLGASVSSILLLLNKEFSKLILIAFVLAIPFIFYLMNNWLNNFNYHINLGWKIFAISGLLIFVLSIFTVSIQSIRAALTDPVDSLRNE